LLIDIELYPSFELLHKLLVIEAVFLATDEEGAFFLVSWY